MDTRSVECFVRVAELLHFGRAALDLHLSQPALSARIVALEREVGARLLERDRRHVALTEAGRAFLPAARAVLREAGAGAVLARATTTGEAGRLRLGFTVIAFHTALPRRVQEFRVRHPDVRVELAEVNSPGIEAALAAGELDLGILHPPVGTDHLGLHPLPDEPLVLALPADHPLTAYERLGFADLAGVDLLVAPRSVGPSIHDRMLACFARAGVAPHVVQEVTPMPTLVGLVAAGAGVGFVTAGVADAARPGVAYRPVEDAPSLPVAAAWLGGEPGPTARRFLALAAPRPWENRPP